MVLTDEEISQRSREAGARAVRRSRQSSINIILDVDNQDYEERLFERTMNNTRLQLERERTREQNNIDRDRNSYLARGGLYAEVENNDGSLLNESLPYAYAAPIDIRSRRPIGILSRMIPQIPIGSLAQMRARMSSRVAIEPPVEVRNIPEPVATMVDDGIPDAYTVN